MPGFTSNSRSDSVLDSELDIALRWADWVRNHQQMIQPSERLREYMRQAASHDDLQPEPNAEVRGLSPIDSIMRHGQAITAIFRSSDTVRQGDVGVTGAMDDAVEGAVEEEGSLPRVVICEINVGVDTEGDTMRNKEGRQPPVSAGVEENALGRAELSQLENVVRTKIVLADGNAIVVAVPRKVDTVIVTTPGLVEKVLDRDIPAQYGYPRYDQTGDVSYFGALVQPGALGGDKQYLVQGGLLGEDASIHLWSVLGNSGWADKCECGDCAASKARCALFLNNRLVPRIVPSVATAGARLLFLDPFKIELMGGHKVPRDDWTFGGNDSRLKILVEAQDRFLFTANFNQNLRMNSNLLGLMVKATAQKRLMDLDMSYSNRMRCNDESYYGLVSINGSPVIWYDILMKMTSEQVASTIRRLVPQDRINQDDITLDIGSLSSDVRLRTSPISFFRGTWEGIQTAICHVIATGSAEVDGMDAYTRANYDRMERPGLITWARWAEYVPRISELHVVDVEFVPFSDDEETTRED